MNLFFKTLTNEVSPYGFGAFRICLGGLVFISLCRYLSFGWIEELFLRPEFRFKYDGFHWVKVMPEPIMYGLCFFLIACSLMFMVGILYRVVAVILFLGFSYFQLLDQALYLNHYYLLCLLLFLMIFLPGDAGLVLGKAPRRVPLFYYQVIRFQLATVYFFAGLAKFNYDWLINAQPMNLWMGNLVDLPFIGFLMDEVPVHYAMAWIGFLYDITIGVWLSLRVTRPYAFFVVVLFHFFTSQFFPIGMFPYIMTFSTLIFFSPEWPLRLLPRLTRNYRLNLKPLGLMPLALFLLYFVFQFFVPLRHFLYPGDVLWNEQGMRFSWKVMVREKNGAVSFRVRDTETGVQWEEPPHKYLMHRQEMEMSGVPDMILQLAHHIGKKYREKGKQVEVFADAQVALNGRQAIAMIDSTQDLLKVKQGLAPFSFVTPAPRESPRLIRPLKKDLW